MLRVESTSVTHAFVLARLDPLTLLRLNLRIPIENNAMSLEVIVGYVEGRLGAVALEVETILQTQHFESLRAEVLHVRTSRLSFQAKRSS